MECKPADRAAFQSHLFPPLSSDLLPLLGLGRRVYRACEGLRTSQAKRGPQAGRKLPGHKARKDSRRRRHAPLPRQAAGAESQRAAWASGREDALPTRELGFASSVVLSKYTMASSSYDRSSIPASQNAQQNWPSKLEQARSTQRQSLKQPDRCGTSKPHPRPNHEHHPNTW